MTLDGNDLVSAAFVHWGTKAATDPVLGELM
jgi:hypothetical protein